MSTNLNLQKLFEGYQDTPQLWTDKAIWDFEQLPIELQTQAVFEPKTRGKVLRLGKWVEEFVSFQLNQLNTVNVIAEGIQIKDNKQTIGELDSIFIWKNQPIHTEIVYKFYLLDPKINGATGLENWIGPNRKDTLLHKLNKLKDKQFPLLCNSNTQKILKELNIDPKQTKQFVHFKAKLFTPFGLKATIDKGLNPSCVVGHYIKGKELSNFSTFWFYIPKKLEWLLHPNSSVNWLKYEEAEPIITAELDTKRSPLVWLKSPKGEIKLLFVVWW